MKASPSRSLCCGLLAVGLILPALAQANWPEFRGPGGQGHAESSASLPVSFGPDENVTWKADIPGKGWSSPIVVDGKIYLTTAVAEGDDQSADDVDRSLRALALDAASGEILWNVEVFQQDGSEAPKIHKKNSHASPTPIVAFDHLFVHFGHMGTACLKLDGSILWTQTSLTYQPVHGNGGSPAVVGNKLIFSCDGPPDPFVAALNLKDGSIAWKTPRNTHASRKFSFSTPLEVNGEVIVPGSGKVVAYDPESGGINWSVDYDEGYSVVPRPVTGHGKVFVSSGFNRAVLYAIELGGRGDITDSNVTWTTDKAVPKNSSFLLDGDLLYMFDDKGVGTCMDAKTGEEIWQERVAGPVSSSPILADGKIYLPDELGVVYVMEAGEEFKELAANDMGDAILSSPAVDGDALILRTETGLFRIEG